ncbi:hypothetical protein [Paludisphaera soli]|uniref:hypothetical protein n=1 Tax=Paludisphaera soli TaxID=2712865 RepID=UPI0013EB1102|nr:hypothetical protein [Paludisphaera soli]
MTPTATTAFRTALGAAVAALTVVTPIEILIVPLVVWVLLARRWGRAGVAGWGPPWGVSILIVLAAAYAPVKSTDRLMDRRMTVPKIAMTLAELSDPFEHGLDRPSLGYRLAPPEGQDGRVVRFGSLNLTVREFVEAIETQTPLRHRIFGCGNGWTILWGLDWITAVVFHEER